MDKQRKPPLHLALRYFPDALKDVASVAEFGDMKHGNKWNEGTPNNTDYHMAKACRHIAEFLAGEGKPGEFDDESNFSHLAHAAHNVLAELQVRKRKEIHNASAPPE